MVVLLKFTLLSVLAAKKEEKKFGEFCLTSSICLVSVVLSASVKRCFVSCMRDFIFGQTITFRESYNDIKISFPKDIIGVCILCNCTNNRNCRVIHVIHFEWSGCCRYKTNSGQWNRWRVHYYCKPILQSLESTMQKYKLYS